MNQKQKSELLMQALATMDSTTFAQNIATAAILPIARQMIEKSFSRKTFQVDQIDGPVAIYQTKRRQTASVIAKYGAAPTRIAMYPRLTVTPYYLQVKPEVELSDLMDAQFDAASDILQDAGAEMAVKEDAEFLKIFNYLAPLPGTSATTVKPVQSPGPNNVGFTLNTNVYQVGTGVSGPDVITQGDPSIVDVMSAQASMRGLGYDPDTILLNPDGLGRMMAQKTFLSYMQAGSREVQETGYIRNMVGLRILWSALVPQTTAYLFDTHELARLVERESLTVKPEFYELRAKWLVYERISPFVRNANAMIRIVWNI